jgi:hypothetical protein
MMRGGNSLCPEIVRDLGSYRDTLCTFRYRYRRRAEEGEVPVHPHLCTDDK